MRIRENYYDPSAFFMDKGWNLAVKVAFLTTDARRRIFGHGDIEYILRMFTMEEVQNLFDKDRSRNDMIAELVDSLKGEINLEKREEVEKLFKKILESAPVLDDPEEDPKYTF